MATSEVKVERSDVQLKHLGFVRVLAINTAVVVTNLYCYAKENSGTLKSTVGKVENAVTAVVGPVFQRFKGVPAHVLVFIDKKVDEANYKFNEFAPPAAKIASNASRVVQELVVEAKVDGPVAAVSHAAKDVAVNGLAALHGVLEIATHWSEKYNSVVKDLAAKGYSFFGYVEEMDKAYNNKTDANSSSGSDSDKE